MPKEIKGNPRRKPPEPMGHAAITEWFGLCMPDMQPIVRGLDRSIRAAVPDLDYAVKYRRAFYGLPELGWLIEIAPYFVSVNILFFAGADFDPPPPLGSVGRTRYVKITKADEAKAPELLDWMEQSGRLPGWGYAG